MVELRVNAAVPSAFENEVPPGYSTLVAVDPTHDDAAVAVLVSRFERTVAAVDRIWFSPEGPPGIEAAVLDALADHYRRHGATVLLVDVAADQPTLAKLLHSAPVTDVSMVKPIVGDAPDSPTALGARPMTPAEYAGWVDDQIEEYARHNLPRLGDDLELARERSRRSFDQLLPDGLDTADTDLLVLTAAGESVGLLWLRYHWRPDREGHCGAQTFIFDVEIAAEHRGRGFGRAAMAIADRATRAAGDRELGLHVFGDNTVARQLYVSDGFRAVRTTYDALRASS